ncbi:hypothetical protein BGW42_005005 [Actinomortierella wolfii]|nr:hypothetical protein BGW42_005005 [Actinomortierella wolfii]
MNLPLELVSNVGDFLELFDKAQLCLISKKWNEQWTPLLYAHVVVSGSWLQYETARDPKVTYGYDIDRSLKKRASLIRSLSLSNFDALEFDCLMACISCPSIAENAIFNGSALSVTRAAGQLSRITLKDFEYAHCIVYSLLQEQPNLKEIILRPRRWEYGLECAFLGLFELIPQWKQLETFEFGHMLRSSKMPFKHLVRFLSRCPTLRHLVLHGLLIEGLDLSFSKEHHVPRKPMIHPALSYLLRRLPTLQHLSVRSQAAFDLAHTPADHTWRYVLANNRALKKIEFVNRSDDYDVEGIGSISSHPGEFSMPSPSSNWVTVPNFGLLSQHLGSSIG